MPKIENYNCYTATPFENTYSTVFLHRTFIIHVCMKKTRNFSNENTYSIIATKPLRCIQMFMYMGQKIFTFDFFEVSL